MWSSELTGAGSYVAVFLPTGDPEKKEMQSPRRDLTVSSIIPSELQSQSDM